MIFHKFLNTREQTWKNDFSTKDAILHTPYAPKVLFIGTFNHGWEWNKADFFYGRDMYMWPILYNIFIVSNNQLVSPRTYNVKTSSLKDIFSICSTAKISFADIVTGTKSDVKTDIDVANKKVIIDKEFKWDTYSDKQLDLLGQRDYLDDNTQQIAEYINNTLSIDFIYFTFKISDTWLSKLARKLCDKIVRQVNFGSIFTPTGNGFRKLLPNYPSKATSITHLWIWVNEPESLRNPNPIYRSGYIHLDHEWLLENNVRPENF